MEWQYNRMSLVGRDLRNLQVQILCHGYGYFLLEQASQIPIQCGLEYFQGRGIHKFFVQPVPLYHYPHSKQFLPNALYKYILF